LEPRHLNRYIEQEPRRVAQPLENPLAKALRTRLERQVRELVEAGPWAPFVVELGISGEERHFWRTSETMQIVSLALPHLSPAVRGKAVTFLDRLWDAGAPLHMAVFTNEGKRREPYRLGPGMDEFARRKVPYEVSVEDLYAVWAYAHYADRWDRVLRDEEGVRRLLKRFAERGSSFEHDGARDESEYLNRQMAGVLAAVRLLGHFGQDDERDRAKELLSGMVTERIHHERADMRLIRPTRTASKGLHQAKVPRYVGLTPEVVTLLKNHAGPELTRNVRALMKALPLWYQAYGERMIGGENYISPPHLSRGIFAAGADGGIASVGELTARLDQPWCRADLYYIEKLSSLLRRIEGD
jgi:hypothetical protein